MPQWSWRDHIVSLEHESAIDPEPNVPDEQPDVARCEERKQHSQKSMPYDERTSLGPVGVRKINRIYKNPGRPVNPDEAGECRRSSVDPQHFRVKRQGKCAKSDDRQLRDPALYPKQFPVEWHQLLYILFPSQAMWHLKACKQDPK